MTLLPSSDFGIRGHEGKLYPVNEICAHPQCGLRSQHAHHLWPRSYLRGQPYDWIELPDGTVIGNRVGLCAKHHDQITGPIGGYQARIVFESGLFSWRDRDMTDRGKTIWLEMGLLTYQPPGSLQHETKREHSHSDLPEGEACPTCGHRKQPARPKQPARKTKDWTLIVPDDAEIGADILDGWADDLAIVLGFGDASSRLRRYHAVATALAWTIQNRDEFVSDLVEASNS